MREAACREFQALANSALALSTPWKNTAHKLPMLGTDEQMKTKGNKSMKHTLTVLTALLLAATVQLPAATAPRPNILAFPDETKVQS
jgi:hypothetical protein